MESPVLQRIKKVIEEYSLTETAFSKAINVNQKTFNQQMKEERKLSLSTIMNILLAFKEISAEWLLRGEGDMMRNALSADIVGANEDYQSLRDSYNRLLGENAILREQLGLSGKLSVKSV
ncbi:MAG: hypothetical protein IKN48_10675 [Bacteroidaceae bacterium]|nr:hypothetical protein [Bacteroidaceae bacterium]